MRALILVLALASCDNASEIIEPRTSNGNSLTQIDCARADPAVDEICVVDEDGRVTVKPDDIRTQTQ